MAEETAPNPGPAVCVSGELRAGGFIRHCGTNMAGFLDVEDVTGYAGTLPDVVSAVRRPYTCVDVMRALR